MLVYVVDRDGEFDVFEDVADAQRVAAASGTTYQEQNTLPSSQDDANPTERRPAMRWLVTETTEYTLEADTREQAEAIWLENVPDQGTEIVRFLGVTERSIEPADAPV